MQSWFFFIACVFLSDMFKLRLETQSINCIKQYIWLVEDHVPNMWKILHFIDKRIGVVCGSKCVGSEWVLLTAPSTFSRESKHSYSIKIRFTLHSNTTIFSVHCSKFVYPQQESCRLWGMIKMSDGSCYQINLTMYCRFVMKFIPTQLHAINTIGKGVITWKTS